MRGFRNRRQDKLREAYAMLDAEPENSDEIIKEKYQRALKKHHPDKGGRDEDVIRVRDAYEFIMEERGKGILPKMGLVDIFKFASMLCKNGVQTEYELWPSVEILRQGGTMIGQFDRIIPCPCPVPLECLKCKSKGYITTPIPCQVKIPYGTAPPEKIVVEPIQSEIFLGYSPIVKLRYNQEQLGLFPQPKIENFLVRVVHRITLAEAIFSRQFIVDHLQEQIVLRLEKSLLELGTTLTIRGNGLGARHDAIGYMMVCFEISDLNPEDDYITVINPRVREVVPPELILVNLNQQNLMPSVIIR